MIRLLAVAGLAAVLSGCQTVSSRIRRNQAAFAASPPEVQEKIRHGVADIGFTSEQVYMALGKPDRVWSQKTAQAEQQVWVYGGESAVVGFGYGFAAGPMGVGVGAAGEPRANTMRITFENGRVVTVERRYR
ncbi:MAG: hypothetical protein PHF00_13280 [Elusimicrobia bacterium]|nr:hypothetical protein [Elusimicrobiota bacterium]